MGRRSRVLGLLSGGLLLAPSIGSGAASPPADAYLAELAAYRAEREEGLRGEYGWLSLVGLVWLEKGANPFGRDAANAVVLPGDATPARAGSLVYDGKTVALEPVANSGLTVNGEPATARVLKDDGEGETADVLQLGSVRFQIIERGERHGVRVRDPQSPVRTGFHGLEFFPGDPRWRVKAVLRPFEKPREVSIQDVLGSTSNQHAPGLLEFELEGQKLSLLPLVEPGETELFIMFRDETSGKETYGAGRYLSATLDGDTTVLDFNHAYNPPCAFTSFATCPLPPRENRLPIRVEAGERRYGDH